MPVGIRPVGKWPTLLAGPMVRRVTRQRAHIFIATSVAAQAQVVLYSGRVAHTNTAAKIKTGDPVTLDRIGTKLWVGLLPVDIPRGAGSVLSYDVKVQYERDNTGFFHGLFDLGLLGGTPATSGREAGPRRAKAPLGYTDGTLPSFVLPPSNPARLRLVHASCRKPHGGGEKEGDALQIVDAAIQQAVGSSGKAAARPQQLILTGDQIYADDVAAGLLKALTEAGKALLGWDEPIPTLDRPWMSFLIEPGWRTRFLSMEGIKLKDEPKVDKPDYSANHLLRFGEWCAMYLFAWSDALWDFDAGKDEYVLPAQPPALPVGLAEKVLGIVEFMGWAAPPAKVTKAAEIATRLAEFEQKVNKDWKDNNPKALGYADSLCQVRRALANIATYTMFDDHEITDDWYLNRRVEQRLKGHKPSGAPNDERSKAAREVGPRMLRNGLSAYAIFQHWGNAPEDFADGRHGRLLLNKWKVTSNTSSDAPLVSAPRSADALLGITVGDSKIPKSGGRAAFSRIRWDYAITFPGHRLIALDTRTWRYFPDGEKLTFASLAPKLPTAPAASAKGAAELRALAAVWRQAGAGAHAAVTGAFADLIVAAVDVADAAAKSSQVVKDRVSDLAVAARRLLDVLPRRAAVAASGRLDPPPARVPISTNATTVRTAVNGLADDVARLGAAVDILRTTARHDLGAGGTQLALAVEALADFVDAATVRSAVGMAYAARRVAQRSGEDLWAPLLPLAATTPTPDALRVAAHTALTSLDTLCANTGVDKLAAKLFRDGNNRLGAGLIRQDALQFQVRDHLASVTRWVPTFFLSPAPIFGNPTVESLQRIATAGGTALGSAAEEEYDFESWNVNLESMRQFFEAVGDVTCAVVLSGDVHYAGSSVNRADTLEAKARYIQLTSSPARNSEPKGRILGLSDDLIYGADGVSILHQADWMTLLVEGSSGASHLVNLTRTKIDEAIDDFRAAPSPRQRLEHLGLWAKGLTLADAEKFAKLVVDGTANTARSMGLELAWQATASVKWIREFRDDPALAAFGDFLTSGPALRDHLRHVYLELGVDPSMGLEITSTALVDGRATRIQPEDALAARATPGSSPYKTYNASQRRTVGYANVGFVSFEMVGSEIAGVQHELRWYPYDDPPKPKVLPRYDWISSLHRAGWFPRPEDLAKAARN